MTQHHVLKQVRYRRQAIQQELTRIHPASTKPQATFKTKLRGVYAVANIFDDLPANDNPQTSGTDPDTNKFSYAAEPANVSDSDNCTKTDIENCSGKPDTKPQQELKTLDKRQVFFLYPMSILTENFPAYSTLSAWLHVMFTDLTIYYEEKRPKIDAGTLTYKSGPMLIESKKIAPEGSQDLEILVALFVGTILLFFLIRHALRSISQRILALDFPIIRMHWSLENPEIWRDCRRIVLAPSKLFVAKLAEALQKMGTIWQINLSDSTDQQTLLKLAEASERSEYAVIVVQTSKVFKHDQATREQLLAALEKLNTCQETSLILYTSLFPWLNLALANVQNGDGDLSATETKRWQSLLRHFKCGYATPDSITRLTSIQLLLKNECRNSELHELRRNIEARPAYKRAVKLQKRPAREYIRYKLAEFFLAHSDVDDAFDEDDLIEEVTLGAEEFHRRMWKSCNQEEQYILYRMAQGNMINTMHIKLLERLLRLGLLRKCPEFRIASYSLRNFILSEETPEDIAEWESQTPESVWTYLRFPLLVLLLMLTVFLAFVGPSVVESLLGLIPAIVLALPLVLRLFSGSGK
jgi:hypothetical protein